MSGKKEEAAQKAVRAALDTWGGRLPAHSPPSSRMLRPWTQSGVRTELSTTVFSAEPEEWVAYLTLPFARRYEAGMRVRAHRHRALKLLAFEAENAESAWLAELLDEGVRAVRHRLEDKPHVFAAFDELLFGSMPLQNQTVSVLLSPHLPSDGTRESPHEGDTQGRDQRVVLHARLAHYVYETLHAGAWLPPEQRLGVLWPLVSRLAMEFAYPPAPLDRFAAKVEVFAKLTYVTLSVLYDGRKSGALVRSSAGRIYEEQIAQSLGMPPARLEEEHAYFRLLAALGFLTRGEPYASYAAEAKIAAREYLDDLYLRLSLSGAMPDVPEAMRPMVFARRGRDVHTPKPRVGAYGIQTSDDLDAWKTVRGPFADLGFTLLRQLGIGEFGRVYQVLNDHSSRFPAQLALKVDRIQGRKKQAILEAEQAMVIGRDLAQAVHLIRLYDGGKLRGERYSYHVLQLVEGDTLDNLVGVTGSEHASVSRPPRARSSEAEGTREYEEAVSNRSSQRWRRQRIALPFTHPLSPAMILDLVSSILLCLAEVHGLDYAINDLKNGNLMMSRRGQLKGIDLDSYAPVRSPRDKVTDFMFLAVSLVLLLSSAGGPPLEGLPWEELIKDEARLRDGLLRTWPFGDTEVLSDGRVTTEELLRTLVDLVLRSRQLVYAKHPELFTADVARLVSIKRRLLPEELVID